MFWANYEIFWIIFGAVSDLLLAELLSELRQASRGVRISPVVLVY
jgi:hypothetical protein